MKTVIYHSADYDGLFCREIARKFLGEQDVQYIGWNYGDPKIKIEDSPDSHLFIAQDGKMLGRSESVYVLDLSPECIETPLTAWMLSKMVWIDHHATSIAKWSNAIPGYRIDGVAACRLAWQWFQWFANTPSNPEEEGYSLPTKQDFIDRKVTEPLAVRLAGEYDVWDKRDPRADILQYSLRAFEPDWEAILQPDIDIHQYLQSGEICQSYARNVDAGHMHSSFLLDWEGLKFLCLNGRGNSKTFASRDLTETGHAALLMFYFNGRQWIVSLYHSEHRKDLDLSAIAVKYGGGGHKGACGFQCDKLPFI